MHWLLFCTYFWKRSRRRPTGKFRPFISSAHPSTTYYIASLDGFSVSHEKWAPFSSVDSSRPTAVWRFSNSFRLWLLWSLHSRSRWPSSGMRPACMKFYFLGHLQNHSLWYCAKWTPIVMLTCWLCIDSLLNTWNLADQFSKLLSNDTWSFSFKSCRNRIPDRGSRICCCSKTLNYLKACLLPIAFAPAGLNLPLCAQFLRYQGSEFLFEEIMVLLKFNSKFSACHLLETTSYGASGLKNFRYCSWWCNGLGCWTLFL
jgi:hypothetical protein